MNNRPSSIRVFGSSLVADPFSPQFRAYRYGGDQAQPAPKPQKPVVRVCAADGCDRAPHAKGHCERHYRKLLAGKPMDGDNRRRTGFRPDTCGTTAGYSRHLRHKVLLCDPCREAKNKYDRTRRAGKRADA